MASRDLREATRARTRAVLGRRSDAAAHARGASRTFLDGLRSPVCEKTASAVELVVSELVTNAVRHARGDLCVLELEDAPDAVSVAVRDGDPAPPRPRTPDFTGSGGFGLLMVGRLADEVTVESAARGKTIRARVPK
ncbi:ATP-binding protein [Streptomyces sp. NBC_00557]|uniref:ATP-binding protein n=1 Tax=Streptomyces sp. NBC_00557 TaxID=2975776 RepID=UPI002E82070E|nr:ATP-binding protein [Streptomyces sp. NBC_00557]WUC33450.1 ATP-binding protein [Streptomyces sp. NBC_00557]